MQATPQHPRPGHRAPAPIPVPAVLALLATLALAAGVAAAAPAAEHMDVDPETTCTGCHAEITPDLHDAWYRGPHGLNNVRCYVCHGSTGSDFRVQVSTGICGSCHPGPVERLAPPAAADAVVVQKSCFACHPPHALSPHSPAAGEEKEVREESATSQRMEEEMERRGAVDEHGVPHECPDPDCEHHGEMDHAEMDHGDRNHGDTDHAEHAEHHGEPDTEDAP